MQNEKQEIHTVFPCFPFFCLTKNLSLPALAYLFRVSLTPLWGKKWVIFRRVVLAVTIVVALMLLPDTLWICAEAVNNLLGTSFQLNYIIPALGWSGLVKIWLHTSFSAFYLILGALCWLAGLGNKKLRDENK